jgi:hypothetical protein
MQSPDFWASAHTRTEVAQAIGISLATFTRRLKEFGLELPKGLIYPVYLVAIKAIFIEGKSPVEVWPTPPRI